MKKEIYPCLWFDGMAKEAAEYYCSVFDNAKITAENQFVVTFEADGRKFMCLNGGPEFHFNPSISFFVVYEKENELDRVWQKLESEGAVLMELGKYDWSEKYGWVQDRFGVSWQLSLGPFKEVGQKFTPSLLFTENQFGKAEQAIKYYTSVFSNSSVQGILKNNTEDIKVKGTVIHAQFKLGNNVFMAMDSALDHGFTFNEAISFVIECDTQDEIDFYWNKLSYGGKESMCGWLKDRFGVSWQVVPTILEKLLSDPYKAQSVTEAFMKMKKFDIEKLLSAASSVSATAK